MGVGIRICSIKLSYGCSLYDDMASSLKALHLDNLMNYILK